MFPIWLKGKGGKGVATTLAVILVLRWPLGVFIICVWLCVFIISRISSLSAITGMLLLPFVAHVLYNDPVLTPVLAAISLLVIIRHHENIKRLVQGKEKRFKK